MPNQKFIAYTLDIDWVHDAATEETLKFFEKKNIPLTIFATHESRLIKGLDKSRYEIGLHPNFNQILRGEDPISFKKNIDILLSHYPEALGARGHSLASSNYISLYLKSLGLKYQSNLYIHDCIKPFVDPVSRLVQIPIHWMDATQMSESLHIPAYLTNEDAPFVSIDLHPIHFYLNTESEERYMAAKPFTKDIDGLRGLRNNTAKPGTRDIIEYFIDYFEKSERRPVTLTEATRIFCP